MFYGFKKNNVGLLLINSCIFENMHQGKHNKTVENDKPLRLRIRRIITIFKKLISRKHREIIAIIRSFIL